MYLCRAWQEITLRKFSRNILAESKTSQQPSEYTPILNLENFCSNIGNVYGRTASAVANSTHSGSACNLVNSLIEACTSLTPGFATMPATNQASCLCYVTTSTWAPTLFDNAVSTCMEFAKTAETSVYPIVQTLEGFCGGVGNIMSTGAVTTTATGPVSTVLVSAAGSTCFRGWEADFGLVSLFNHPKRQVQ